LEFRDDTVVDRLFEAVGAVDVVELQHEHPELPDAGEFVRAAGEVPHPVVVDEVLDVVLELGATLLLGLVDDLWRVAPAQLRPEERDHIRVGVPQRERVEILDGRILVPVEDVVVVVISREVLTQRLGERESHLELLACRETIFGRDEFGFDLRRGGRPASCLLEPAVDVGGADELSCLRITWSFSHRKLPSS